MRAGARLKTTIQISSELSRADPERKTTGVCLCLHPLVSTLMSQPKSSHESPEKSQKSVAGTMQRGCGALYSTQAGLQGQLHLKDKAL